MKKLLVACRSLRIRLRDWLRGYSYADIVSLRIRLRALEACTADTMIWLSERETRALRDSQMVGVYQISVLSVIRGRARIGLRIGAGL